MTKNIFTVKDILNRFNLIHLQKKMSYSTVGVLGSKINAVPGYSSSSNKI